MFTLLFLISFAVAQTDYLNEFSADVDIYDMGIMGRGKNAASWHRTLSGNQEVFYYLAMQPWRHLVWTDCTSDDGECYKFFINEDASNIPSASNTDEVLSSSTSQDYCRKEYAHPMAKYEIDWSKIEEGSRLDSIDINGETCYEYPGKNPLVHIYLREHYNNQRDAEGNVLTPCRYDFIGGKSITFRSHSEFSKVFITNDAKNGYLVNKTRCRIEASENNLPTSMAIILGITDKTMIQSVNGQLSRLKGLKTVKKFTIYYLSGSSYKKEEIKEDTWNTLTAKQISPGSVDALINIATNDLVKEIDGNTIKKGTIVVLMDRSLSNTFDAETKFDRNSITVHVVSYNKNDDPKMKSRAESLLSLGEHYHELKGNSIETTMTKLFKGIRVNLTERCDRTKCNGFCDGRDRCTCPMCCENDCFYTYCETSTGTCTPWPVEKPKAKVTCETTCAGKQECIDLQGCVYTSYNEGCEPPAKCMKVDCVKDKKGKEVCQIVDGCQRDEQPSYQNRCWRYECNKQTGKCERTVSGDECPSKTLCDDYYCDDDLKCTSRPKECVKTAPYVEMNCYVAKCNKRTGRCENRLKCDHYESCGATSTNSVCSCNDKFECECSSKAEDKKGFCLDTEICDSTSGTPKCAVSACGEDLFIQGCKIKRCDATTKTIYYDTIDCSNKVKFTYGTNAGDFCSKKWEPYCDEGLCYAKLVAESTSAGCGYCNIKEKSYDESTGVREYEITYEENCASKIPLCANGLYKEGQDKSSNNWIQSECKEDSNGKYKCVFGTPKNEFEFCADCNPSIECNKDHTLREYTYNNATGGCSVIEKSPEQCTVCDIKTNANYIKTCTGSIPKTYQHTFDFGDNQKHELTQAYTIAKICKGNQCIPHPDFDCNSAMDSDILVDFSKVVTKLQGCIKEGLVEIKKHYSSKYDPFKFASNLPQSEEFLKEAETEAYCEVIYKEANCKKCNFKTGQVVGSEIQVVDRCKDLSDEYTVKLKETVTFECTKEQTCQVTGGAKECPTKQCKSYFGVNQLADCQFDADLCELQRAAYQKTIQKWKKEEHPGESEVMCAVGDGSCIHPGDNAFKSAEESCPYGYDDQLCKNYEKKMENGEVDEGCKVINKECNTTDYHCTFKTITRPEEDYRFFTDRDKVVFGDLCYQYRCVESVKDGKLEHHWVLTDESLAELNKKPESLCETMKCNPETGKAEATVIDCLVSEKFPTISEAQAECFYCQCSYKDGSFVLTMYSDTDTNTYELDACGNCIVKDRKTGKQINAEKDCVLKAQLNIDGAIAGASVAASVVFGLVGAMVIVSIGAFQTYQLVSSAMKNVIATTLENPEFVQAENEAVNALADDD